MAKKKTTFVCQECGGESPKWLGKCPNCGSWNSLVEEMDKKYEQSRSFKRRWVETETEPIPITKIEVSEDDRMKAGISELDRVLGGGFVLGSVVLIGGDPGIGKSTLMLQTANKLSESFGIVLYVSGEESMPQIKLRADRLGITSDELYLLCETDLDAIETHIDNLKPRIAVIDSIQTTYNSSIQSIPGSISQVKESGAHLLSLAKSRNIPIILIGHVTKEGTIAGPKVLEHMVDAVLYLEGESQHVYRILRGIKNRFGSTNEIGIFEMSGGGLVEVLNPSELFLSERQENISGSVVVSSMEATRPLLLELQALVSPSNSEVARNTITGVDRYRVALLIAVLEKRVGLNVTDFEVFINITGGLRINEPGVDLGVILALASSYRDTAIDYRTVVIGEVGLGGEVRAVNHIERRLREAAKLGFTRAIFPENNRKGLKLDDQIELIGVKNIYEALDAIL